MGAFEKAVPEEANKGPPLSQTSHVIRKGPNTIFMSVDPLCRGHRWQFPESFKRGEPHATCFPFSQVFYFKKKRVFSDKHALGKNTSRRSESCWKLSSYNSDDKARTPRTTRFSNFNHILCQSCYGHLNVCLEKTR